jgi:hypothetical protein
VAADTTLTAKSDTAAYFVLDTVNKKLYFYKASAIPKWNEISGSGGGGVTTFSAGTTGLTPNTATSGAVTLGGTLAVANGGTGSPTKNFVDLTTTQTVAGSKTFNANVITQKSTGAIGSAYYGFSDNANNFKGYFGYGGSLTNRMALSNNVAGDMLFITSNSFTNKVLLRLDTTFKVTIGDDVVPTEVLHVVGNARTTGNIAAGVTSATARLHLAEGTATASTAPLKFTSGINLTTAEAGALEFNGTNLFFSPSTTRHTVNHGLTGSATLNFPSTTTLLSADLTITVTGAADGDVVSLGVPNAAVNANTSYSAWVSAANTVTVRFNNYSSGTVDPASALFKVFVTK